MIVVPGERPDPVADSQAARFVAAGVTTLASAGLAVDTALRHGDATERIEEEATAGGYGLVVVGSPPLRAEHAAPLSGLVGRLLASAAMPSMLIVRSA
jgi:hypothetical protein